MHPRLDRPTTVTISITNQCNLHCAYCYSDCNTACDDELTIEQWLDFVDYLVRHGFIASYFEGGEPLVRPGFVRVLERSSRSMMTWLRTHATLIDRRLAERLKQAGLGGAFVDLMGATAATHDASLRAGCRVTHRVSVRADGQRRRGRADPGPTADRRRWRRVFTPFHPSSHSYITVRFRIGSSRPVPRTSEEPTAPHQAKEERPCTAPDGSVVVRRVSAPLSRSRRSMRT